MGKKKDEPEEAEPEPEPEPEETPEEKEEMAQDILGQMADGIVAERERDAAARPIAVADALGEAMSVLSHRFTHHDTGSSVEEQQGSTWTLGDERNGLAHLRSLTGQVSTSGPHRMGPRASGRSRPST